jgi:hypothetical protein
MGNALRQISVGIVNSQKDQLPAQGKVVSEK